MRSHETFFIIAVLGVAAVFAALSVSNAWDTLGAKAAVEFSARGTAGVPRDVDVGRIKQLIEAGRLSNHEAEFYHRQDENPPGAEGTSVAPQTK